MKIRDGFVSNSSSSSFMVRLKDLTGIQLHKIMNIEYSEHVNSWDHWSIETRNGMVIGSVSMDNFSMDEYLTKIGVDEEKVQWSEWDRWQSHNYDEDVENDVEKLVKVLHEELKDQRGYDNSYPHIGYETFKEDEDTFVKIDGNINLTVLAKMVLKYMENQND